MPDITLHVTPVRLAGWTAVEMYKGPLDGTRVIVLQLQNTTRPDVPIGLLALVLADAMALRDTLNAAIQEEQSIAARSTESNLQVE